MRDIAALHSEYYHVNNMDRLKETKGILSGNCDSFMKEKSLEYIPEFFQFMYWTMNHCSFLDTTDIVSFASYDVDSLRKLAQGVHKTWQECYEYILKIDYGSYDKYDIPSKARKIWEDPLSVEDRWSNAFKALTEEAPLTLVHGDFRADNVLIKNNKMKLIDWQCTSLGCGLIDIMSLLYNSMSVETLVDHEDRLLEEYVNILHDKGCLIFTLKEAKKYLGLSIWYEFKNMALFANFFKTATADISAVGVQYVGLQKLMVRKVVTTIYGLYKYCYDTEHV